MSLVRRAVPEDAEEVLRLRQVMIDSVFATEPSTAWHAESLPTVRRRLADHDGNFAAFVVDHPDRPDALAALVAGTIDYRIGRAGNPHGAIGYVFSVATDPNARRRGYAARASRRSSTGPANGASRRSISTRPRRPSRSTSRSGSCASRTVPED